MAVEKICLGGNKIILSNIIFPSQHKTVSFKQTTEIATKIHSPSNETWIQIIKFIME